MERLSYFLVCINYIETSPGIFKEYKPDHRGNFRLNELDSFFWTTLTIFDFYGAISQRYSIKESGGQM